MEALQAYIDLACHLCHAADNRNESLASTHRSSRSFVSRTFLAHHELESDTIIIIIVTILITIIIMMIIIIIIPLLV